MGSVYRRGKRWWIKYTAESGAVVRRSVSATRRGASAELRRVEPEPLPGGVSLGEILGAYIQHLRVRAKASSVEQAEVSSRHLLRILKDRSAARLSGDALDRFIEARRGQGAKATTINGNLRILRAALRFGVERRMLPRMPLRVRLLKAPRKKELPILGPAEVEALLRHAREPYHGVILVAAHTGFRLSEVLHLAWADVDWREGRLSVTAKAGWQPKSYQERVVYVPRTVIDYLRKRRSADVGDGLIFTVKSGGPIRRDTACRNLVKVWRAAGLVRPGAPTSHWLRHSMCSRLLGAGVDIETVRQIMGHSSATTTLLYAHTSDERLRRAALRLEAVSEIPTTMTERR